LPKFGDRLLLYKLSTCSIKRIVLFFVRTAFFLQSLLGRKGPVPFKLQKKGVREKNFVQNLEDPIEM
jgi:hypothetical protein